MGQRKRSHDEFDRDSQRQNSLGEIVARISGNKLQSESTSTDGAQEKKPNAAINETDSDGWQKVESKRSAKKRKKEQNNYPGITHSAQARLQSFVKISDLQNLVLYLLADGTAPQWVSVRHHGNVRKVVCVLVPGLEVGMFDGRISLAITPPGTDDESKEDPSANQENGDAGDSAHVTTQCDANEVLNKYKLRLSPDDYYPTKLSPEKLPDPLKPLSDVFLHMWPIKTPGDDKFAKMHSPLAAMLTAPIPRAKEEKNSKGPSFPSAGKTWQNKRTPITEFLATIDELMEHDYTLHPAHLTTAAAAEVELLRRTENNKTAANGWVDLPVITSLADCEVPERDIEQGSITAGRRVLAMDCEMCITSPPGTMPPVFSLTRISLVEWDGNVVMDELVKPAEAITDYLTPYSGITAALLEPVTITLPDIHTKLKDILSPQTILIGHSLDSDLKALKMTFPFIVDTALLFPHPRGPPLKSSLKWLVQKYLGREIQKGHGKTGHNSVEDAEACLDLVKQKCEKGPLWGTSEASGESIFKRLGRSHRPKHDKVSANAEDELRTGAVVDWGEPSRGFGGTANVAIGCCSDHEVLQAVKRAVLGDDDGSIVPGGGVDFVWARLRELEAHRGWWRHSKQHGAEELRQNLATTNDDSTNGTESSPGSAAQLAAAVTKAVDHIKQIYEALPPCAALIVYSGSGDPRPLTEMQNVQQRFKEEYKTKKWDELSVRWTDVEEQRLRAAATKARLGLGFIAVK